MQTNEKSECNPTKKTCCQNKREYGPLYCYQCHLPCDLCHKQPEKLAEAKNLLKTFYYNWKRNYGKKDLNYHSEAIDTLIKAASLISYERGREEQRKEMAKTIAPMCGIPDAGDACRAILKYLNLSPDAK